ncbi:MAG: polysaccharide biosynthesis/export family protein [Planctomycetota bacterium]
MIKIDMQRLGHGDLRYNAHLRDGDELWISDQPLFDPKDPDPLIRADSSRSQYSIRPGDILHVTIYELVEPGVDYQQRCVVHGDGTITLFKLGAIDVQGQIRGVAESKIARALEQQGILRDATLSIQRLAGHRAFSVVQVSSATDDPPIRTEIPIDKDSESLIGALSLLGFGNLPPEHVYIVRSAAPFHPPDPPLSSIMIGDWSDPVIP